MFQTKVAENKQSYILRSINHFRKSRSFGDKKTKSENAPQLKRYPYTSLQTAKLLESLHIVMAKVKLSPDRINKTSSHEDVEEWLYNS
jgi:hypothetical protein